MSVHVRMKTKKVGKLFFPLARSHVSAFFGERRISGRCGNRAVRSAQNLGVQGVDIILRWRRTAINDGAIKARASTSPNKASAAPSRSTTVEILVASTASLCRYSMAERASSNVRLGVNCATATAPFGPACGSRPPGSEIRRQRHKSRVRKLFCDFKAWTRSGRGCHGSRAPAGAFLRQQDSLTVDIESRRNRKLHGFCGDGGFLKTGGAGCCFQDELCSK